MFVDYEAVGLRVKKLREKAGLTQEELANKADISIRFVSNIENGSRKMSLETVINIANALSISVDDLLCDNIVRSFHVYNKEAQEVFNQCSDYDIRILLDVLKATKESLAKDQRFRETLAAKKEE